MGMFSSRERNIEMLKGAYLKYKSYYYYNKNLLMMRKKVAKFEEDENVMEDAFNNLAFVLQNPKTKRAREFVKDLLSRIDFIILPKKFENDQRANNRPVTNTIARDKKLKSVNFFIDAPIEIYILDTLWTIYLAKISHDNQNLSYDVYGNTVNESALFQGDQIVFGNRILFNRYFNKYCLWRNNAFGSLEKNYEKHKDSVLVSLDIKSFFYSTIIEFDKLDQLFGENYVFSKIEILSLIMEKVYDCYLDKISAFRIDIPKLKRHSYILPIGLFSSMLLGNIYLSNFDKEVRKLPNLKYYGRYVDDILFVFESNVLKETTNKDIIYDLFVKTNILVTEGIEYKIKCRENLRIQSEKIKIIYIDHKESRALIDIYNDTIKIIPSQMDPLPDNGLNLSNFDEIVYTVENFTKEKKIRDIGHINVDSFKVGKYFSNLLIKYSHMNILGKNVTNEIEHHIMQINNFFAGSQGIEFYTNWLNYAYFLVLTQKNKQLKKFLTETRNRINGLKGTSLDRKMYRKTASINKKVKEALLEHINISIYLAMVLDREMVERHFKSKQDIVMMYEHSNMFNHNLVAFPLANYLKYTKPVSYIKMDVKDLGRIPKSIKREFKFVWSPRFIHYDELIMLRFYFYHRSVGKPNKYDYINGLMVEEFCYINHINYPPFIINSNESVKFEDYTVNSISIPCKNRSIPKEINVAVGSVYLSVEKCIKGCGRWENITLEDKNILDSILRETYKCIGKKEIMLLVLPELYFPIYWIGDLIRYAKRAQIAIVTGLQYMLDNSGKMRNYVLTLLPFKSGRKGYKNVYVHIREKNDYSPIEFEKLAKLGYKCKNTNVANYEIFKWNNVNLSSLVCYELTDIMARALIKGRCDIIAAPVFNPDTTYFSNIIDSTARDLHAFIIQANTSFYGDSRVTGPYDRDSKDIFKIKGGDNDHVVVGTIKFRKVKQFEEEYENELEKKIKFIEANKKIPNKKKIKPDIKPLSARFKKRR